MSISAAMIIKRGECENLKRCLASIKGIVSEIVAVVDPTPMEGDTTDEILVEYKAKEILLPWPGDYAAARNESLKHVSSDWVLVIDTDEYLKSFDFDEKASARNVYRVIRENTYVSEDNAMSNTERITRLFRKDLFLYTGKVHEQVTALDGHPYTAGDAAIILGHTGYTDQAQMLQKAVSYRKLLSRMLEEDGEDPYVFFQIGRTYYVEKKYREAAAAFEKAIDSGADTKDEYVESLIETYGYTLLELGRNKDAMSLTGFEEYRKSADYLFLCGLILMNNALFEEAINCFLAATKCTRSSVAGTDSYAAWYNCGVICEVLGNKEQARLYYEKAGSYEPALKGLTRLGYN